MYASKRYKSILSHMLLYKIINLVNQEGGLGHSPLSVYAMFSYTYMHANANWIYNKPSKDIITYISSNVLLGKGMEQLIYRW